jgi:hypothetical protein
MVIYNDDYVIALENKIGHIPINPFKDYESEINIRYTFQKKLYYIFSLSKCEDIDKWNNKLIGDIFSVIKNKLQFNHDNNGDYFVEDFLDHYIEEKIQMTNKDADLCEKNFSKFMNGRDLLDQFIENIISQLRQGIKPQKIKKEDWEGCIALRLKPFENDFPDIVL